MFMRDVNVNGLTLTGERTFAPPLTAVRVGVEEDLESKTRTEPPWEEAKPMASSDFETSKRFFRGVAIRRSEEVDLLKKDIFG
jgi:hypothetical protein